MDSQNQYLGLGPIIASQFLRGEPSHQRFPSRPIRPHSASHSRRLRAFSLICGVWNVSMSHWSRQGKPAPELPDFECSIKNKALAACHALHTQLLDRGEVEHDKQGVRVG